MAARVRSRLPYSGSFGNNNAAGLTYSIPTTTGSLEIDDATKESQVIARMDKVFSLDCLLIATKEANFQRAVTVEAKNSEGSWEPVADGVSYNFDSPGVHSSHYL